MIRVVCDSILAMSLALCLVKGSWIEHTKPWSAAIESAEVPDIELGRKHAGMVSMRA